MEPYETTKQQREIQREAYINSIEISDVCKLASHYNDSRACRTFRNPEHGSFNVCFFVIFPSQDKRWVVRFPVQPALHDAWEKLQSEVATMQYITNNTTIPIPRIYGYGPGGSSDIENPTRLPYVILEYVPGRPLEHKDLVNASPERSTKLYTQLADILSQLRMQEFDHAGSLITDPDGATILTRPLSIDMNTLQLHKTKPIVPCGKQSSAIDFAFYRYHLLFERLDQPLSEMDEEDAQHEVFALEDFKGRLFGFIDPLLNHRPFVLAHGDLRPSNIIVDEDLTIHAIIDWEWSGTVPRQFFIPPTWFSGYEALEVSPEKYRLEYLKFYSILREAGSRSISCRKLAEEWGPGLATSINLFLPAALSQHCNFTHIYFKSLFPRFYKGIKRRDMLRQFFDQDGQEGIFNEAVKRKLEASEKYTQYLRENGLLIRDEQNDLIIQALQRLDELGKKVSQDLAALNIQSHIATEPPSQTTLQGPFSPSRGPQSPPHIC